MKKITFLLLILFLFFVSIGSAPIEVSGVKIDNVIGVLLAISTLVCLLVIRRLVIRGREVLIAACLYFAILFLSVFVSPDPLYSIGRFSIIFGYGVVAIFVPYVLADRLEVVGLSSILFSALAASLIWVSYFVLGMSSWGRMTLPTYVSGEFQYFPSGWGSSADPNILGFGLLLMLVFGLFIQRPSTAFGLFVFSFVLSAVLLTMSRTAVFSFIGSAFLTAIWLAIEASTRSVKIRIDVAQKLFFGAAGIVFFVVSFFLSPLGAGFIDRVIQIGAGDSSVNDRLERYEYVISNFCCESVNVVVFGVGFDMARLTQDPHNIYLTALHDSGVLGLLGLIGFMLTLFLSSLRISTFYLRLGSIFIFFYIALGGVSYWHTKTFWVAVMFIVMLRCLDRRIKGHCESLCTQATDNSRGKRAWLPTGGK